MVRIRVKINYILLSPAHNNIFIALDIKCFIVKLVLWLRWDLVQLSFSPQQEVMDVAKNNILQIK